jgi:hypothetical protein
MTVAELVPRNCGGSGNSGPFFTCVRAVVG